MKRHVINIKARHTKNTSEGEIKNLTTTLPSSSESSSNNYPPTTDHDYTAGPELVISKDQAE